jgi:hypothetical protein
MTGSSEFWKIKKLKEPDMELKSEKDYKLWFTVCE